MIEVEIRGRDGSFIAIAVQEYERPSAEDSDDANWLRCSVQVQSEFFRGEVHAAFTTHDFVEFARELRALSSLEREVAAFRTYEAALEIDVRRRVTGALDVRGVVQDARRRRLEIEFESDLSYLSSTLSRLDAVLQEFPVRAGSPRSC